MQTICRKCAENAVLLVQYSCESGEDVHKVNVNKEEGVHSQQGRSARLVQVVFS